MIRSKNIFSIFNFFPNRFRTSILSNFKITAVASPTQWALPWLSRIRSNNKISLIFGGLNELLMWQGRVLLTHYVNRHIIKKMGTGKLLYLDKEEQLSKTGTYHIMLRGNERKSLFPEEEDYGKFLQILTAKTRRCF